jgi:hypothetical protein
VSPSKITALKVSALPSFLAHRGVEATNVVIVQRAINSIAQLPKIPKRKLENEETKVSGDLFRSTM